MSQVTISLKRRNILLRTTLLILGISTLLLGCQSSPTVQPDSSEISSDELVGIWSYDDVHHWEFRDDGTYRRAVGTMNLNLMPDGIGTYRVENGILVLMPDDTSNSCAGEIGKYRVIFGTSDELQFTMLQDRCLERGHDFFSSYIMKRVEN